MKSEIKAFIFDVFGTVVDWRTGVASEVSRLFHRKGIAFDATEFADLWRGEYQPAMEKVRGGDRGYIPLDRLHRENLDAVLGKTRLQDEISAAERDDLNHAWEKLPPWPDTVAGLTALKRDFIIAPCSNGSIALMTRLAKFGALPWDCILGADIAQNYKPERDVYLACCAALQLPPAQVAMVAAHNDDLAAARDAGLTTVFFPRPSEHGLGQTSDLTPQSEWDICATDIVDLAAKMA